jgi:hypothetical protein
MRKSGSMFVNFSPSNPMVHKRAISCLIPRQEIVLGIAHEIVRVDGLLSELPKCASLFGRSDNAFLATINM